MMQHRRRSIKEYDGSSRDKVSEYELPSRGPNSMAVACPAACAVLCLTHTVAVSVSAWTAAQRLPRHWKGAQENLVAAAQTNLVSRRVAGEGLAQERRLIPYWSVRKRLMTGSFPLAGQAASVLHGRHTCRACANRQQRCEAGMQMQPPPVHACCCTTLQPSRLGMASFVIQECLFVQWASSQI